MPRMMGNLYNICNWVMLLSYINLLWIMFTFAGLIILGFMPATTALFAVSRKWIQGNTDIPVFRTFWNYYKSEFIKSNKLGVILAIIGYVLYFYLKYFQGENFIISLVCFGLFIYYFLIIIYIFPISVHYKAKTFHIVKNALIISLISPIPTVLIVLWIILSYFIFTAFPGLIIFFSASTVAFVTMYFSNRIFERLAEKHLQTTSA